MIVSTADVYIGEIDICTEMNLGLFPKFFSKKKTVNEGPTEIGLPTNVLHEIHVSKNLATGLLEGLPTPWLRLLNTQLT